MHLVAHSLGAMFGCYLLGALGPRVTRLTLVDPVIVSVLRETGENEGYAEMEAQTSAASGGPNRQRLGPAAAASPARVRLSGGDVRRAWAPRALRSNGLSDETLKGRSAHWRAR